MSSQFRAVFTVNDPAKTVVNKLNMVSVVQALGNFRNYIGSFIAGSVSSKTVIATTAVAASDDITFSSIANNDTVTVNGRVYTAKTSGASGAQQFNIGGSDAAAALNFQAKVNADTSTAVLGVVTATSKSSGVTTVTCLVPGNIGLRCTASGTGGASAATANFTGGSEDANVTLSHGI